jgi:hypothetical protein
MGSAVSDLPEGFVLDTDLPEGFVLDERPSTTMDVLKSIPAGLARGTAGVVGGAGDLNHAIRSGLGSLGVSDAATTRAATGAAGSGPLGSALAMVLADPVRSSDVVRGIEGVTGPLYQPQTTPGKYANTISEFVPSALTGAPETSLPGVGRAIMRYAVAPGAAAETASQLTEGSDVQPYAKLAASLAAPLIGRQTARLVDSWATPDAANIIAQGAEPTIGQTLGGSARTMEEHFGRLPVIGGVVQDAKAAADTSVRNIALNTALGRIGEQLPGGAHTGNEAVDYAHNAFSNAYDTVMPSLSGSHDAQLRTDIEHILTDAPAQAMLPARLTQAERIINSNLVGKAGADATQYTGEQLQSIDQALRQGMQRFRSSPDPDVQDVGQRLGEARDAFHAMLERSNAPEDYQRLLDINRGYAELIPSERAAASVGAQNGDFTPAQLHSAVKASNQSVRKSQFSRGGALLQDLSSPAKNVMLPGKSSGTAENAAGLAALLETVHDPAVAVAVAPYAAGAYGLARAIYSPTGQRILRGAAAGMAGPRQAAADAIRSGTGSADPWTALAIALSRGTGSPQAAQQ